VKEEDAEETEMEWKEINTTLKGTDKFIACFLKHFWSLGQGNPYFSCYQPSSQQEA